MLVSTLQVAFICKLNVINLLGSFLDSAVVVPGHHLDLVRGVPDDGAVGGGHHVAGPHHRPATEVTSPRLATIRPLQADLHRSDISHSILKEEIYPS